MFMSNTRYGAIISRHLGIRIFDFLVWLHDTNGKAVAVDSIKILSVFFFTSVFQSRWLLIFGLVHDYSVIPGEIEFMRAPRLPHFTASAITRFTLQRLAI